MLSGSFLTGKILTGCRLTGLYIGSIFDRFCILSNGFILNGTFERSGDVTYDSVVFGADEPISVGGKYVHHGVISLIVPTYDVSPFTRPGTGSTDTAASAADPDKHGANWDLTADGNSFIHDILDGGAYIYDQFDTPPVLSNVGLAVIPDPPTPTTKIDIQDKTTEELGYEELPNTEFTDTTNITTNNATLSTASNELTVTSTGLDSRGVEVITTEVGGVYELTIEGFGGSDVGSIDIIAGSNLDSATAPESFLTSTFATGSFSSFTGRFVATESTMKMFMGAVGDYAKFTVPTIKKITTVIDRNPIRAALGGLPGGDELFTGFTTSTDFPYETYEESSGILHCVNTSGYGIASLAMLAEVGTIVELVFVYVGDGTLPQIRERQTSDIGGNNIIITTVMPGLNVIKYTTTMTNSVFSIRTDIDDAVDFVVTSVSIKEIQPIRTEITVKDWAPGTDWDIGGLPSEISLVSAAESAISLLYLTNAGIIKSYDSITALSSTFEWASSAVYDLSVHCGNENDMLISDGSAPYEGLAEGEWFQLLINGTYSIPLGFSGYFEVADYLFIPYGSPVFPMAYGAIQIKDLETDSLVLDIDFIRDAVGTLILKNLNITPAKTEWQTVGPLNILSGANGNQILYVDTDGFIKATDGTNTCVSPAEYVAGVDTDIALIFGDGNMQILQDGVPGGLSPFEGTFLPGDTLKLAFGNEDIFSVEDICGNSTATFGEALFLAQTLGYDL